MAMRTDIISIPKTNKNTPHIYVLQNIGQGLMRFPNLDSFMFTPSLQDSLYYYINGISRKQRHREAK